MLHDESSKSGRSSLTGALARIVEGSRQTTTRGVVIDAIAAPVRAIGHGMPGVWNWTDRYR